uniref:DUF3395 domain-containing protein n=1 Tax=Macrostomum lignano TaxID=282301 RepID=A0A1I8JED1_9PLAT
PAVPLHTDRTRACVKSTATPPFPAIVQAYSRPIVLHTATLLFPSKSLVQFPLERPTFDETVLLPTLIFYGLAIASYNWIRENCQKELHCLLECNTPTICLPVWSPEPCPGTGSLRDAARAAGLNFKQVRFARGKSRAEMGQSGSSELRISQEADAATFASGSSSSDPSVSSPAAAQLRWLRASRAGRGSLMAEWRWFQDVEPTGRCHLLFLRSDAPRPGQAGRMRRV